MNKKAVYYVAVGIICAISIFVAGVSVGLNKSTSYYKEQANECMEGWKETMGYAQTCVVRLKECKEKE